MSSKARERLVIEVPRGTKKQLYRINSKLSKSVREALQHYINTTTTRLDRAGFKVRKDL